MMAPPEKQTADSKRILESLIRDLEGKRYKAVLDMDLDSFENLCHPRLVYSHSDGNRDSGQDYMAKLRTGALRYHGIENSIEGITIIGNTALVLGRIKADLTVNGTDKTMNNSSLAVWVKEGEKWKFIAYQPTPLLTS
jgi:hypothetical protein